MGNNFFGPLGRRLLGGAVGLRFDDCRKVKIVRDDCKDVLMITDPDFFDSLKVFSWGQIMNMTEE